MIGHLLRLAWNRRRMNALVLTEIFVCFLVLCGLATAVTGAALNWMRPLGFEWRDVLVVTLDMPDQSVDTGSDSLFAATTNRLRAEVAALPGVEAAALGCNVPYSNDEWSSGSYANGKYFNVYYSPVTPGLRDVLRLDLVAGRWLEPGDETLEWKPTVITRSLARTWFGTENPLGKSVPNFDEHGAPEPLRAGDREARIVGVLADFRRTGEPANSRPAMFVPANFHHGFESPRQILVRVRPGTPPAFEETLTRRLQTEAPDWTIQVDSLARARRHRLNEMLLPLWIAVAVVIFLTFTVGMGLIGVLWQSITRRLPELGVRRALGATAPQIVGQIVGELLAMTFLAIVAGGVLFLQVPLLHLISGLAPGVFLLGFAEATVILCLFVAACALYPGWMAARIPPARALQHE